MKTSFKILIFSILTLIVAPLALANTYLWEYGDFNERKNVYEYNFGNGYVGNLEQNIKLLDFLIKGESLGAGDGTIGTLDAWKSVSGVITPRISSSSVKIPSLSSANLCLATDSNGLLKSSSCGGGSGASTTINGTEGPFTFSTTTNGTNFSISTSTNGQVFFNIPYATSTATGLLTLQDWADLKSRLTQGQGDLLYYAISNPSGYISSESDPIWSAASSSYLTTSNASSTYVPYTGANSNTDLGSYGISFTNATSTGTITANQLCFAGDGCQTAIVSAGSVVTFYHWNQLSDITGYERLRTYPNNGTEIAETATSSSGSYGQIDSYISTTTDLSITSIPSGIWSFHYYANIDSNVGNSRIVARVYIRNLAGTETLLLTATSSELTTGLKEYDFNGVGQATTTLITDRIVIKPYIYTDSISERTMTFYYDGLTNYSHVITPFSLAIENFTRSNINETITGLWTFGATTTFPLGYWSSVGDVRIGTTTSNNFPNARLVSSKGVSGHTYTNNIGIVGESIAEVGYPSIGVGGIARTNGIFPAYGVAGRAIINNTSDSGTAVGVEGLSEGTHVGGSNIGVYSVASGGLLNYSFYGNAGDIYNNGKMTITGTSTLPGGIWQDNGNVGIGTTTPNQKLSVVGNGLFSGDIFGANITTATTTRWNTAYTDRLKWDGGATDLVAATGRTSLGLGSIATFLSTDYLASTTQYVATTTGDWLGTWQGYSPSTFSAETTSTIGTLINSSTASTTPSDTDRFAFSASSLLRHITWANIKTALTSLFDTLYQAILLDGTPNTDHTANGPQTNTFNSGYSSTIMDLVYMGTGGKWLAADADATSTSQYMLAIALEAKTDTQAMKVATAGSYVRDDSWTFATGTPLYIGTTTAGTIISNQPSGTDDVIRIIGWAVARNIIYFMPETGYMTHN